MKGFDGVGVLFPFEVGCYEDVDLPVSFVGHPFVAHVELPVGYRRTALYSASRQPGATGRTNSARIPECVRGPVGRVSDLPAQLPVPDERIRAWSSRSSGNTQR